MAIKSPQKSRKKSRKTKSAFTSGFWKRHWKEALILFVVATGPYWMGINYEFVLDDQIVITENDFTKAGFEGVVDMFRYDSFYGYFGEQKNLVAGSRYRPLSLAMFAIEYELAGMNTWLYHLVNILLYGFLCLLIFRVLSVMFFREKPVAWYLAVPFIAALIFALHPIHTEAVANIKGRDEILAMLFALGAMYATFRYADKKSIPWLITSGLILFAGTLAKENTITFLAVIPAALYYFTRVKYKYIGFAVLPLVLAVGLYLLVRIMAIGFLFNDETVQSLMNNPFLGMSGDEVSATIMYTLGHYVRLLVFPHPLTHDYYPYHIPIMHWSDIKVLLSLGLYLAMAVAFVIGIRRKTVLSFSVFYFFATLSIVSNIVFPIGTFMNERFAFMPSLALCLIVAWYGLRLHAKERVPKWLIPAFFALYLGAMAFKTVTRVPAWKDTLSLNSAAIKVSKNSARANTFMGTALFEDAREISARQTRYEKMLEAEVYIDRALAIVPDYRDANQMKSGVLVEHYRYDGDLDALLTGFAEILSRKPNVQYIPRYCEYLNGRDVDANKLRNFYYHVGYEILTVSQRQYEHAKQYLALGLQFDPNDARLNLATGLMYQAAGDNKKAQSFISKAYALDPSLQNRE